jgi:hypothetical protein
MTNVICYLINAYIVYYSILFINILYYKNKSYIYTNRVLINESILIRVGSRALIESSRVYTS